MVRLAIDLSDVEAARRRISGRGPRHTPLIPIDGTPWLAKCEGLQATGSFKIRGATNAVLGLQPKGVVTSSSGNHGRALATAAAAVGIPCTVVMTPDTTEYKREAIRAVGGRVVICDEGSEARNRACREIAARDGLTMIPPYDHPLVMAGQGTTGLEIVDDVAVVTAVVVPVSGGGLISGIATAVKARSPSTTVIGVEPAGADDTVRSRAAGHAVTIDQPDTICDGARVQRPGELTFPIVQALVDDVISVDDDEVVAAMRVLAQAGIWAEPTGALSVAGAARLGAGAGTVCVVSGRNVAPADMARLLGAAR